VRFHTLTLRFPLLLAIATPPFFWAQKPTTISGQEVDRSVIANLSHEAVTKPKVIAHVDLTEPFATATQWTFVVVQDGSQPAPDDFEDHGPIFLCLVKATSPDCALHLYQHVRSDGPWFDTPYRLYSGKVVYATQDKSSPLLFLQVCGAASGDGDCGIATALYQYNRSADRFVRVFLNLTGRNNNQNTRFVESGPLQGDAIVDVPTDNAPYGYWIELYRANESGQYAQILRYRSRTHYGDGNPLAVADSEMPEILNHLGLWKPGDALPVPAHMPKGCSQLYMRSGEEWCK